MAESKQDVIRRKIRHKQHKELERRKKATWAKLNKPAHVNGILTETYIGDGFWIL